jgi:hypothetical protein
MDTNTTQDAMTATVTRGAGQNEPMMALGHFVAECYGADGKLKWTESFDNLVTTQGKNFLLDTVLIAGSAGTGALTNVNMFFRMSYITSGTPVIGDTYATHAGFTELGSGVITPRGALTFSASAAGVKATSAAMTAAIVGTGTVTGVAINVLNAAAVGTLGTVADTGQAAAVLYSAGLFGASKSVTSGDTLNVTYSTTLT